MAESISDICMLPIVKCGLQAEHLPPIALLSCGPSSPNTIETIATNARLMIIKYPGCAATEWTSLCSMLIVVTCN